MSEPSDVEFPWDRHWVRSGSTLRLDLDGYIMDPTSVGGFATIESDPKIVRRLSDLSDLPLVGLEGDVGIGKSRMAIRSVRELTAAGKRAQYVDAAELETVRSLTDLIEASPDATFFIDGVDEFEKAGKLTAVVRLAVERGIFVRFVCRTAAWPEHLRTAIEKARGSFFEALPLTRREIVGAAEAVGVDATEFLRAVHHRGGQPLAMKPLTLVALLAAFKRGAAVTRHPHGSTDRQGHGTGGEGLDDRRSHATTSVCASSPEVSGRRPEASLGGRRSPLAAGRTLHDRSRRRRLFIELRLQS